MPNYPRIGLGLIPTGSESTAFLWALEAVLQQYGIQMQLYQSRSYMAVTDGAVDTPLGRQQRHLDSWVMSEAVCQQVFRQAADTCDISVVCGHYDSLTQNPGTQSSGMQNSGSSLQQICSWLRLPKVAAIDVSLMQSCQIPAIVSSLEGVFLFGAVSSHRMAQAQVNFESIWKVPILGTLQIPERFVDPPTDCNTIRRPTAQEWAQLGRLLEPSLDLARLLQISQNHELPEPGSADSSLATVNPEYVPVTVAVAYDDCFCGYFPDALDSLEREGATIRVFSPLRDEKLPPDADIVFIGCGFTDRYAEVLARNECLIAEIRQHACSGKRIYAEGGGLAYLCRHVQLSNGQQVPMVGALPAVAHQAELENPLRPYEISFRQNCWLAARQSKLRGYLNTMWQIEPVGPLQCLSCSSSNDRFHVVGRHQVIGSNVHLNFAALPQVLERFFSPSHPSLDFNLYVPSSK